MFPWNIAKSAEAMFSRWAVKRVCKFLLKKKLGQFILGDIDLEQLDVQLIDGTIQLTDLALNVDFLNDKLAGAASLYIKEGSIGSLLVRMPWKGKGCQLELDEFEVVLAPCPANSLLDKEGNRTSCQGGSSSPSSEKHEKEILENIISSSSGDVHEGVKIIAKMVKWLLTSFHVKIKKLIIAYDPHLENSDDKSFQHKMLVLRCAEIECGTCVSEDVKLQGVEGVDNIFGISRLTNYVTFHGAILEMVQMDDAMRQSCSLSAEGTDPNDLPSGFLKPYATDRIVTGKGGGFSGNLRLSIPWLNGSLNMQKVDADVSIDPLDLRLQPHTIEWLLISWETYKNLGTDEKVCHMHYKSADNVQLSSIFRSSSPTSGSLGDAIDDASPACGSFSPEVSSLVAQGSVYEVKLPHLISDWVPSSVNNVEQDFGASVDQFFSCFDGMRNSQSTLGGSGMWNWTCSVFNAITAASNLASGSLNIPSEQQHVETNLKATVAGISLMFSFQDEGEELLQSDLKDHKEKFNLHYLALECTDISLMLKVCPRDLKFEGSIRVIEVDHYMTHVDNSLVPDARGCKYEQTVLIQKLQNEVQGALPQRSLFLDVPGQENSGAIPSQDIPFENKDDVVKITLLKTLGVLHCQFFVKYGLPVNNSASSVSFSVNLPPFIFWVNFRLLIKLLTFLREVENVVQLSGAQSRCSHDTKCSSVDNVKPSFSGTTKGGSERCFTTLYSEEGVQGVLSVADARIILCFPFHSGDDLASYSSWDQFIALDIYSPLGINGGKNENLNPFPDANSDKKFSLAITKSLRLNLGNLDVYAIASQPKDNNRGSDARSLPGQKFTCHNIISVANGVGYSVIRMIWQDGPVTGPWIVERAKSLAWSQESKNRTTFMEGHEFASVTAIKDPDDSNSQIRQEIILSAGFFIHVHLASVVVNLDRSQYEGVHCLINQMIQGFTCSLQEEVTSVEELAGHQTSFLVECDSLEFVVKPNKMTDLKSSMLSELPGSWCRLRLKIQKFELLYASNLGGITGANFCWLSHGEGKLLGSITSEPDQDFLLISCCDSTVKRGDGEGSNALSSGVAGSDIVHLFEPRKSHGYLSITVRCGTIVANGGRLDWFDAISSFFMLPSSENEYLGETSLSESDRQESSTSCFVLNLIDIGLSYEPHLKNLVLNCKRSGDGSNHSVAQQVVGEHYVACILAASSLNLTHATDVGSTKNEYVIRVQDLGLLLSPASELELLHGIYDAQHLRKAGYVKVAGEALVQVKLRISTGSAIKWHLECSDSQIDVETCHDTTSGLIKLMTQLQQLFAPDVEESLVHLQNRWDNHQREQDRNAANNEIRHAHVESAPLISGVYTSGMNSEDTSLIIGLMDEISDDAFVSIEKQSCQYGAELQLSMMTEETLTGVASNCGSFGGSAPSLGLVSCQSSIVQKDEFPGFIEGYCVSDLRSLSEFTLGSQPSREVSKYRSSNVEKVDLGGKSGWYSDTSVTIVEDHISESSEASSLKQSIDGEFLSPDLADIGDFEAVGHVLVKNLNVRWRMYAGSDWGNSEKISEVSNKTHGRDKTIYLELLLSGMDCYYDMFPEGGFCVSKLSLTIKDVHLYDNSRDAPLKQVLGYYHSKDHPRESFSQAFKMELEAVRPDPSIPLEEYRLCISLIPLRLNLHQRQLDFFINFFGGEDFSHDCSHDGQKDVGRSKSLTANVQDCSPIDKFVDEALLPYFQKFDILPLVVRVEYIPERLDLAALGGGKYVELVNLIPWKGVELLLKHVHAVGVYGWSNVCETIVGEWLEDISHNQIRKVLRGIPPIRSVTSIGSAAAKLISCPVESYRKDGRVLRGVQRGTVAFLRSVSLEAVGLGVHLAAGADDILRQAEYVIANKPSDPWPGKSRTITNVRSNQPRDAQQGIQKAYESISGGLGKSASALIQRPIKKYQRGASAGGAIATAFRAVPAATIAPVSACASAVHFALLGLRNSLDPEHKKESMEKYMGSDPA